MSAIYLLIPLAMLVLVLSIGLFFWAVKRGQFDDLESPGHSILFDDQAVVDRKVNAEREANAERKPGDAAHPESSQRD